MGCVLGTALWSTSYAEKVSIERSKLTSIVDGYGEAILLLEEQKKLLLEEKERWKRIHNNPVPDQITIDDSNGRVKLDITIDTKVSNRINSEPIKRSYTLSWRNRPYLIQSAALSIGASWMYSDGLRPLLACTYVPTWAYGVGIGGFTSLYTTGLAVSYTLPQFQELQLFLLTGITVEGKVAPGLGAGIRF